MRDIVVLKGGCAETWGAGWLRAPMASDSMRVRLHLRETRVLAVASDMPSELRVEVESTVRRPRCPACGFR